MTDFFLEPVSAYNGRIAGLTKQVGSNNTQLAQNILELDLNTEDYDWDFFARNGTSYPVFLSTVGLAEANTAADSSASEIIDAYTKGESNNRFGDLATQLQHGLDIGTLAQLTTADKTSLVTAVNELVARKVNSIMVVPLTGPPVTYTSAQVAANTAPAGSTLLLRGYQQALDVNQALDLNLEGAYFGRNQLGLLPYPAGVQELAIQTQGGSSNWRVGVLRQNATCSVVMEGYVFGPAAWAELFGVFTNSPHVTSLTLRRCRGTRRIGIGNPAQNGNIAFQCRPEGQQLMNLYLEDCGFTSTIGSVFTGFLHNDCRIVLRGTTKLNAADGAPLSALTTLNGSGAVVPADMSLILVDER